MSRLHHLLSEFLPVFNSHQLIEGDTDLVMTMKQARNSDFFLHWCETWGDDERGELAELLRECRG